jgi:hypothetical protein
MTSLNIEELINVYNTYHALELMFNEVREKRGIRESLDNIGFGENQITFNCSSCHRGETFEESYRFPLQTCRSAEMMINEYNRQVKEAADRLTVDNDRIAEVERKRRKAQYDLLKKEFGT